MNSFVYTFAKKYLIKRRTTVKQIGFLPGRKDILASF